MPGSVFFYENEKFKFSLTYSITIIRKVMIQMQYDMEKDMEKRENENGEQKEDGEDSWQKGTPF